MDASFDCIVLGTGPAGSAAAALVAAAGWRTLLVEPQRGSRWGGGQSLLPASLDIVERLGLVEPLRSGQFVPKYATELIGPTGQPAGKFAHSAATAGEMVPTPRAWQVAGCKFKELLHTRAVALGCTIRDTLRAVDLCSVGPRTSGLQLAALDGSAEEQVSGRILIDCSGPKSLVAERFGVRRPTPTEQQRMAVWGLYEKAHRAGGIDGGSSLFLRTLDRRAWFWFIPLSDNRASVGVVGSCQSLSGDHARPESVFEEQLVKCPAVVERPGRRSAGGLVSRRARVWLVVHRSGRRWLAAGGGRAGRLGPAVFGGIVVWTGHRVTRRGRSQCGAAAKRLLGRCTRRLDAPDRSGR